MQGTNRPTIEHCVGQLRPTGPRSLTALAISCFLTASWMPWTQAVGQLPILTESSTIGTQEGPRHLRFGRIEDVVAGRSGRIFVLDSRTQEVRVFDPSGKYAFSGGRPGRGPGELVLPEALTIDRRGQLYVSDRGTSRISVFQEADTALVFKSSFPVSFQAMDICAIGERLFVLGLFENRIVHEFTTQGKLTHSFGEPFQGPPLDGLSLLKARLECVPESELVVVLPVFLPVVQAYSVAGKLVWSQVLRHYRQMSVTSEPNGAVRYQVPPGGYFMGRSLLRVSPDTIAVQLAHMKAGATSSDDFATLHTRYLSLRNGTELASDTSLSLISLVTERAAIGVRYRPFSQLVTYTRAHR
jgi:hypothetical protein